jgi:hypothetical protein
MNADILIDSILSNNSVDVVIDSIMEVSSKSAKKIKGALPVKPAKIKTWTFEFTLKEIIHQTEGMDRSLSKEHAIAQAALGIGYAYETGRLPGGAHLKLRRMNGIETIQLVGEVADKNLTQADTVHYLLDKYKDIS